MEISSSRCENKDTSCEFKSSDVPPANCSLIEQQGKSYCGVAANDADSVQEMRISKANEINRSPEIDMSIDSHKKKPL